MKIKLTNIEKLMLAKGYVSARMIAAKTGQSRSSATRFVKESQEAVQHGPDAEHGGRGGYYPQKFVPMGAVKTWLGGTSSVLGIDLRDWSDIVNERE